MSLAQHLQKKRGGPARPRPLHLYNSRQKSEDTEFSESAWSMASTLRSDFQTKGACLFTPSDAFSPEENAILLKLSQELNQFQQDDIISIVEEFTLASSRRDSVQSESTQSAVSKRISRLSVASMTILEGLVFEEQGGATEGEDDLEEEGGEEKEPVEDEVTAVTVSETQHEEEEDEEKERLPNDNDGHGIKEEEVDEEPAELAPLKSEENPTTSITRSNLRKSKRRSTLADLIHSRRPSSLVELINVCQDGAETWSRNLETLLSGDWNGKIVTVDDQFDDGDLTEDED